MKTQLMKRVLILAYAGLFMSGLALAQTEKASPATTATGKIKDATITIQYSSPAVKGRKIFGELVPYDKVWRAGANEATIFETDKALKVEGKDLPAGKYSVYAIPGEKEWTIIFNKQTGQWGIKRSGESTRDTAQDALTVKVKPKKSASLNERLKYDVNNSGIALRWENVEVPVSIK